MAAFNGGKPGRNPMTHPPLGEEIVISGIAGAFPESDDILQFQENILNKADLTTEDERRWKNIYVEIPARSGKLNEINKFDASFFGIPYKQAHLMDPLCRLLIEKSYEAIVDAGCNPKELRDSKTGVFIGISITESEKTWMYERVKENVIGLLCTKMIFASQISYYLGLNGPCCSVDTACSSSAYALESAYRAIRQGRCEAALVAGINLVLHPFISLQFSSLGVLSPDGRCKTFDESGNGYCRSEAVGVLYLQKSKDAKRIYSTIVHVKTNCDGFKEEGITFPSAALQQRLLTEFYEECDIDPSTITWIEAHGTGTKVGDPQEVKVLENVFCKGRKTPLLIGSVKSNMGHTEPASCICSIVKAIIAMETGIIPPNINFSAPRSDIESLHNGKISVISERTPWNGATVGVNSFGFGGANGHVLLKWNEKQKSANKQKPSNDQFPLIVFASGRTEQAVEAMLTSVKKNGFDEEHISLLYEVYKKNIPGHYFRGYIIHNFLSNETIQHVQKFGGKEREIWFIFRESETQKIPLITNHMMQLPGFSAVIQRCHKALLPHGINFFNVISGHGKRDFSNFTVAVNLCTTSIQIGLIEVLANIGIVPDKLLGFSSCELVSAYADGTLSLEQTIVATYYVSLLQPTGKIGKEKIKQYGYSEAKSDEINLRTEPSNSKLNVNDVKNTVMLKQPFFNGVHSCGESDILGLVDNHVKLNDESETELPLNGDLFYHLEKVIIGPKQFSKKFMCCRGSLINNPPEKTCSPEYIRNLLSNCKSTGDIFKQFKRDTIILDFSFCENLWSVQKFNNTLVYLPLNDFSVHGDFVHRFLRCLGRLYEEGLQPFYREFYPKVELPVSRGTPMISPHIRWDHSKDWFISSYNIKDSVQSAEKTFTVSLKEDDLEYLSGHVIDGRNLFPATGYLELVWKLVGILYGAICSDISVVFRNVKFLRATNIPKEGTVDFHVSIQRGSGDFQVVEGGAVVVTGNVAVPKNIELEMSDPSSIIPVSSFPEYFNLAQKDIYKELRIRGYNYKGLFKSLVSANNAGSSGKIVWLDNWVTFMDNMLQINILNRDSRHLIVPVSIDKLVINSKQHFEEIFKCIGNLKELPVNVYGDINLIKSGGIEIKGLIGRGIARKKVPADPVLEKYEFVPYSVLDKEMKCSDVIRICAHIVLENIVSTNLKALEAYNRCYMLFAPLLVETLGDLPLMQGQIAVLSDEEVPSGSGYTIERRLFPGDKSASLVIIPVTEETLFPVIKKAVESVIEGGFIIWREDISRYNEESAFSNYDSISDMLSLVFETYCQGEKISLLRKISKEFSEPVVVQISDSNLDWLLELQTVMQICKQKNKEVLIVSQGNPESGIMGFTNCIRKEPGGSIARCLFIKDQNAPDFSLDDPFYWKQVKKGLAMNVLSHGEWGSYRHLPLSADEEVSSEFGYIDILNVGDLSSFSWQQLPIRNYVRKDKAFVYIYYSAVNFRDVMIATGRLSGVIEEDMYAPVFHYPELGFEYSGRLADGKRVMGLSRGCFATAANTDKILMWDVPESWTLEDAATVPVVYCTVLYAVFVRGHLLPGESILIHAGSGGVGLAAINVALYAGCIVFTTVSSKEKREFVKSQFPQLTDSHIGYSRDTSFEMLVMQETNGKGVDLVLNSLAEDKLQASVRCLAEGGRFLEIGKYDLQSNNPLGMKNFTKAVSFHGVMLDIIMQAQDREKIELQKFLSDALKAGAVKPLRRTVFDGDQCEEAFRYFGAGKHMGKVLLKHRNEEPIKMLKPPHLKRPVKSLFHCRSDRTYIVVGGLGGFGLELIDWLIYRGARNFVITSRNGIRTGYQAMRVRIWREHNIKVEISTLLLQSSNEVKKLLMKANKLAQVAGIFNLAVVLKDALFENMNISDFKTSLKPKAYTTFLLDEISRELCPQLEKFVVFSSVSCGRGNAGQTNYGMANSVMERICEKRRNQNLHGLAVQWGAVGDVGLVADMQEENVEFVIGGTLQQKIRNCLDVLGMFLLSPHAVVSSMVVAEKQCGFEKNSNIVDTIFHILGIHDKKTVSVHSTLAELGMDSMTAVEIKQILEQKFEIFLTSQDIRVLTVAKLQEISKNYFEIEQITSSDIKEVSPENPQFLLMRFIGEETLAKETIVKFPCHSISNSPKKNNTLILIPGIEGSSSVMEPLAKNLLWQVYCLQFSSEYSNNCNISSVAQYLIPEIRKCITHDEKFVILGYSFGAVVALEVTYLLEKEGYEGHLILLDGSPDYLRSLIIEGFLNGNFDEDNLQRIILLRAISLMWPSKSHDFADKLNVVTNWEDRLNLFVNYSDSQFSETYRKEAINSIYCRVKAALSYEGPPEKSIMSSLSLIRPTENSTTYTKEDYGLSRFCSEEISIHILEGNHITVLENEKIGNILCNKTGI